MDPAAKTPSAQGEFAMSEPRLPAAEGFYNCFFKRLLDLILSLLGLILLSPVL